MEQAFGHRLQMLLSHLQLDPDVLESIQSNLVKLGGLQPPPNIDAARAAQIRADIMDAFVFGFRWIMLVCAALAVASAWIAFRVIPAVASAHAHGFSDINKVADPSEGA